MRLIDADARIDDLMERYCKECDKRKGMKNGKRQFIYDIGEAPCRACEVDDVKAELEEAPSIEPRRGKWVLIERRESQFDICGIKTWAVAYRCSECGFIHTVIEDFGHYTFCPNCGAKMEKSEE